MDAFWTYHYQTFFTEIIATTCAIIGMVISINRKQRKLRYFAFYFGFYILLSILLHFQICTGTRLAKNIFTLFDHLFTLLEFIIFINFINSTTENFVIKKINLSFLIFFTLFFILISIQEFLLKGRKTDDSKNFVYTVECLMLFIPLMLSYIQMFQKPKRINLTDDPIFWVNTGILFALFCSLPYSLIENYIRHNNYELLITLYSIFYVLYALLFFMIIRAHYCNKISE